MSKLLETISFENGEYPLLEYHQERLNRAFEIHFPGKRPHQLHELLPSLTFSEKHKVRAIYDSEHIEVEFSIHHQRKLESIRLIHSDVIRYSHKYADRSALESLFSQRDMADEILIVKQGMITDTFYANAVFYDGSDWYTPETHLLPGVRRSYLLDQEKIQERSIGLSDLGSFELISLVNALTDLGELSIPVSQIKYKSLI